MHLARPTSGNAGQHAQTQQRSRQSLAIPADPETPLPPSAAEQQRDGGQQRRDVAVAFVRAEAREQPGSQEIHRQPTPAPTVIPIPIHRWPPPGPKQQTGHPHHQRNAPQLLRQQTRVPEPALQTLQSWVPFPNGGLDHGPVSAAKAGDPVVPQPGTDQENGHRRQDHGLTQPGTSARQGKPGCP